MRGAALFPAALCVAALAQPAAAGPVECLAAWGVFGEEMLPGLPHGSGPTARAAWRAKLADAETWGTKLDLATIDHAVAIAGIDHVGLSSPAQSVPQWKEYTGALIEHGYSAADTAKIMGENVVRVLKSAN